MFDLSTSFPEALVFERKLYVLLHYIHVCVVRFALGESKLNWIMLTLRFSAPD